ncbi:MAG: hypothetical protein V3T88_05525 [Nitrosomonadaceae bacterium]
MAHARIVVNRTGTVIRNMKMDGQSTHELNQVAATLESIICEDFDILRIEVCYEGCDDSKTVEDYNPHD